MAGAERMRGREGGGRGREGPEQVLQGLRGLQRRLGLLFPRGGSPSGAVGRGG